MQFDLFGLSCEKCEGRLALFIKPKTITISSLKLKCRQCEWEENILDKGSELYGSTKKKMKDSTGKIAKTLVSLKDTLPKNREEWKEVIKNPKHPFTAALLAGLVLIMMELSGFGIFMVLTWILGNLILNPVGWVLIPLIVAITFKYRSHFKRDKLNRIKKRLKELEQKKESEKMVDDEFEFEKNKLLGEFFD
ncbi:MAG: hypothetical protein MI799_17515 [Desulfobacterales bacterium]|nr:hypothetical protein [Desulfobacterales bacterium]